MYPRSSCSCYICPHTASRDWDEESRVFSPVSQAEAGHISEGDSPEAQQPCNLAIFELDGLDIAANTRTIIERNPCILEEVKKVYWNPMCSDIVQDTLYNTIRAVVINISRNHAPQSDSGIGTWIHY